MKRFEWIFIGAMIVGSVMMLGYNMTREEDTREVELEKREIVTEMEIKAEDKLEREPMVLEVKSEGKREVPTPRITNVKIEEVGMV